MRNSRYFLVLDVGTSGIKALLFTKELKFVGRAHQKIKKYLPFPGHVEQDPKELLEKSMSVMQKVVEENKINPAEIAAIGITNQRETTILWDKTTGKPVYRAIVWEDERTQKECEILQKYDSDVRQKTGLTILPYFSATKISWILKNIPEAQSLLKKNTLLFGTVDSWILWNISKERNHFTDYTNASRTMLFNIKNLSWDKKLLQIFSIPSKILPKVFPTQHIFGTLKKNILGVEIPIAALCGDQQSSIYASGINKGDTKITYGTGTFIMQSLGKKFALHNNFFTTIIPFSSGHAYAIEAKVNNTGKRIENTLLNKNKLLKMLDRITIETARAVKKLPILPSKIIVDGGITQNNYIVEKQEKLLNIPIKKFDIHDGTSFGTAKLLKDSKIVKFN